jgi:hypothetical protein
MDNYFMSYSPNDFFWVSVSGEYDLARCESIIHPKNRTPQVYNYSVAMGANSPTSDPSACPCAATPTPTPAPTGNLAGYIVYGGNQPTTTDPTYLEVCKNYVYANDLARLQVAATTGNELSNNILTKYHTKIMEITNLCVGITILGMLVFIAGRE